MRSDGACSPIVLARNEAVQPGGERSGGTP